ncbi:LOW QUALITY PROTEIN: WD repeat-containing protein 3-like [Rhynchonycteris naso]
MGLNKQYLRYVASAVFGLIGSQKGNIVLVILCGEKGHYVAVPTCEHVFIWDLRREGKPKSAGSMLMVTCLHLSPNGLHLAVGYEDRCIRIFSPLSGEGNVTFSGHRAAITFLKYNQLKGMLASESRLWYNIIVWDVINESGHYLNGHKDAITQALFLEKNLLISSGKDTMVKWWDLDTQHCFRTTVGHTEVWGLVLVSEEKRFITGASDSELRAWDIVYLQEVITFSDHVPRAQYLSCFTIVHLLFAIGRLFLQIVLKTGSMTAAGCESRACGHDQGVWVGAWDHAHSVSPQTGKLQLCDLALRTLLETVDAHNGAVWSVSLSPDQHGFVTGGVDKAVKFWDFELVKDENSPQRRLSVTQTRALQLEEDVLYVRYFPDQKLVAVSLLDCTVKVFYVDTLKFFLSLYGHKLPVICMDISYDGALIATGSADRSVKIWGLDFGDCHKSLFAHDDSVMYLQFVPKTHLFFTSGKDRKIKQWDADRFEHVQMLEGNHQEIWCLAVSPSGDYVMSSSHDKSLRLWERTREPLILEEERELQWETEYEESLAKEGQPAVLGKTQENNGRKSIEIVKAAERIMEAVELYLEETAKMKEHKAICKAAGKEVPLPTNPILMAYGNISPLAYVLKIFKGIKSSELEESLLVLPFSYVPDILSLLQEFIQLGSDVEPLCRGLFFLLR